MKRREFITLLGGAAAAWPLAARAQQREQMRRIGVLMHTTSDEPQAQAFLAAFLQGLQKAGWEVGRNLRIETRWSGGDPARLPKNAAELVALNLDAIMAGAGPTLPTLLRETRTVPIVFAQAVDPVGSGSINSLAQPDGNATGFLQFEYDLAGKWLELLKEVAPQVRRVGVLRVLETSAGAGQWAVIQAFSRRGRSGAEPHQCAHRGRHRARRSGVLARAARRPDRDGDRISDDSPRLDRVACAAAPLACGLSLSLVRHRRRPDLLRPRAGGPVPTCGRLRRPHPKGREAGRPAGASANQVRAGDQPQDRQGARPRRCRRRCSPAPTR